MSEVKMLSAMRVTVTRLANRYGIGFFVYCGVSVVSALCEWSVFMACLRVVGPVLASVTGFVCATGLNFILSHFVAFRSKRPLLEEMFLVAAMSTVAFMANFSTFYLLFTLAGLDVLLAKIIGTCAGFGFNYTLRQFYIFSRISRFPALSKLIDRGARFGGGDIVALHRNVTDSGETGVPPGRRS